MTGSLMTPDGSGPSPKTGSSLRTSSRSDCRECPPSERSGSAGTPSSPTRCSFSDFRFLDREWPDESTGSRKEALAVPGCVKSGRLAHGWSFLPGPAIYARPAVPGQAPIDARSSLALGAPGGSEMLLAPVRLHSSVVARPSVAPPAAFTRVRWAVGPGRTRFSRSGLVCVARLAVLVCRPVHASLPPIRVMLRGSALGSNPSSSRPLGSVDAWRKRAPCQAVRAARLAPRAVWCTFLLVAGLTDFEREGARVKGPSTSRTSRRVSIHRRRTRKLLRGSNTQSCAIL